MSSSSPPQSPQMLNVVWNPTAFAKTFQTAITEMLEKKILVDVTIQCENARVQCHQIVLAACSPYFAELLAEHPPTDGLIICMAGLKGWQLHALISFMYRGEVNGISMEQLADLCEVAKQFRIKGLTKEETLSSPASDGNVESRAYEEGTNSATESVSSFDHEEGALNQSLLKKSDSREIPKSVLEDMKHNYALKNSDKTMGGKNETVATTSEMETEQIPNASSLACEAKCDNANAMMVNSSDDAVASSTHGGYDVCDSVSVTGKLKPAKVQKKNETRKSASKVLLPKAPISSTRLESSSNAANSTGFQDATNQPWWSESSNPHVAYVNAKRELLQASPVYSGVTDTNERRNGSPNPNQVATSQHEQYQSPYSTGVTYNQEFLSRLTSAAVVTLQGTPSSVAAAAFGIPESILNDYLIRYIACGQAPSPAHLPNST